MLGGDSTTHKSDVKRMNRFILLNLWPLQRLESFACLPDACRKMMFKVYILAITAWFVTTCTLLWQAQDAWPYTTCTVTLRVLI
jgi:hypothetical protein